MEPVTKSTGIPRLFRVGFYLLLLSLSSDKNNHFLERSDCVFKCHLLKEADFLRKSPYQPLYSTDTEGLGSCTQNHSVWMQMKKSRAWIGLPWRLCGKEPTCQSWRCRFDPSVGKTPWRRKWQPPPVFLPGESITRTEEPGGLQSTGSQESQSRLSD